MIDAHIRGVGQTPCGRLAGDTIALQAAAVVAAVEDAELHWEQIDGLITMPSRVLGNRTGLHELCTRLALSPRVQLSVEMGGASTIAQIGLARSLIRERQAHHVICVGGQSFLSEGHRMRREMVSAGPIHKGIEQPQQPTIPGIYALLARQWLDTTGAMPEDLAELSAQIRTNAVGNTNAKHQDIVTPADVLASPLTAEPLHLLDCASLADGAVALVVSDQPSQRSVRVGGIGYASGEPFLTSTRWEHKQSVSEAGNIALREVGRVIGDIDVLMLYDSFSISVAIQMEGLGICDAGQAGQYARSEGIGWQGRTPVCTHGGLLAAGQPGIAGGGFHVAEAVTQIRGEAGHRQVPRSVFSHRRGQRYLCKCRHVDSRGLTVGMGAWRCQDCAAWDPFERSRCANCGGIDLNKLEHPSQRGRIESWTRIFSKGGEDRLLVLVGFPSGLRVLGQLLSELAPFGVGDAVDFMEDRSMECGSHWFRLAGQ